MTNLLIKLFIKDEDSRDSYGKLGGWVGITSNLTLFLIKFLIGIFTTSLSIMTDAINNLSDASASVITVVGFKMSAKPADEDHPYGHARFEYISGMLVSCLVFLIGAQFFTSSVKKTINPESTLFNWIVAVLLVASILVKLWQSAFYNKVGAIISSKVLIATAIDSRNDVIITTVVLVSAIVESFTGWRIDGPVGVLVSLFVMYSGIGLLRDTLDPLLGAAPKKKLVDEIYAKINSYDSVISSHDLLIHNYGPDRLYASVHVEMPASQDILISHEIIDDIERDLFHEIGINLVVHLDPVNTDDKELMKIQGELEQITREIDDRLSIHDFRIIRRKNYIKLVFEVTVPLEYSGSNDELRYKYQKKASKLNEKYQTVVAIDRNYTVSLSKS